MSIALLELEGVVAGYGAGPVLRGVDLAVAEGEVVAVLGPNGAGKTTMLRVASGLLRPSAGLVTYRGRPVGRAEELVRAGLAHVPQGRGVFAGLTARRNLELGAFTRRDRAAVRAEVEAWLERFPVLASRVDQPAGLLSGGEQQLLVLGRALLSRRASCSWTSRPWASRP